MKKIWMISDTHQSHHLLNIPENIDIVIHSGDATNNRAPSINSVEMFDFLEWYMSLPIKYKIFVAGNHDTSIEHKLIRREMIEDRGIIYLEHEGIELEGLKIWGSPYTKAFGIGWAFNVRPDRLHEYWLQIPIELDILVTHGPPKGILDLSFSREGVLEYCGDVALRKAILKREIKYHQYGHLHNCNEVFNAGTKTIANCPTVFVNASCSTDRKIGEITSHGEIITI